MKITPDWLEKKIETEPEIPFDVICKTIHDKSKITLHKSIECIKPTDCVHILTDTSSGI